MFAHTYEVLYAKGPERLRYLTCNKLEAFYLYYKIRDNKRFDNNRIIFKIDGEIHEVVRDDAIELMNEKISLHATPKRSCIFNLDGLLESEF